MQLVPLRRPDEVREHPAHPDQEGQDPQRQRERREVLDEVAPGAAGEHGALDRAAVDAEHAVELACERQGGSDEGHDAVCPDEQPMPGEDASERCHGPSGRGHPRPAPLERKERDGNNEDDDRELRPRVEGQRHPEQREQVVPGRRRRERRLDREHRPEECRVGGDLGEQKRGKNDPGEADREHSDQVCGPEPSGDPPRKQERGYAGRGHDPGVRDVCQVEIVRHEPCR